MFYLFYFFSILYFCPRQFFTFFDVSCVCVDMYVNLSGSSIYANIICALVSFSMLVYM